MATEESNAQLDRIEAKLDTLTSMVTFIQNWVMCDEEEDPSNQSLDDAQPTDPILNEL